MKIQNRTIGKRILAVLLSLLTVLSCMTMGFTPVYALDSKLKNGTDITGFLLMEKMHIVLTTVKLQMANLKQMLYKLLYKYFATLSNALK